MTSPRDKKQLRLLNEVLPDPTPPAEPGNARQRVLASVSRLGALAAAMASMQPGCSGDQAQGSGQVPPTVDIPGTNGSNGPVANASGTPETPPTHSATATKVPDIPSGYAVVDPMPPPATCLGVAPTIQATAKWTNKKSGGLTVEVKLGKPGRSDASYGSAPVTAWGGSVSSQQVTPGSVVLTVEPTAGSSYVGVQVPLQCAQGPGHIAISIDLTGKAVAGGSAPVSLQDTY